MLDLHFQQQISRLVSVYGERAFPEERVKLIHRTVIDLDSFWLERFVNHAIGSMRQAPLLPDFLEAAKKERARKHDIQAPMSTWADYSSEFTPPNCFDCNDEGTLTANQKGSFYSKDFICHCKAGEGKKGTRWSFSLLASYEIDPARIPCTKEEAKEFREKWRYLYK